MKKYKVWVECEEVIKANSLNEALKKFSDIFEEEYLPNIEFNGVELK